MYLVVAAILALPYLPATLEVPEKVHNGDLFLVEQKSGGPAPEAVEFNGVRYPALKTGEGGRAFYLLAVDLDTPAGKYDLSAVHSGRITDLGRVSVEVGKRDFPVEELSLPTAMVSPPKEVLDRIGRERKEAAAVYAGTSPEALWSPPFEKPAEGEPSGNFGRRRILNGISKSPHSGEDYSAPLGRVVRSTARGRVRMSKDLYYSGNTVLIDHGAGLVSQYFHLDTLTAGEGDIVEKGEPIGTVGATGRVTGPHLHFGIRLYGSRADPAQLWNLFNGN